MAEEPQYHPKDAIGPAVHSGLITGAAGLTTAAVQATLTKRPLGILGAFTNYGTTIAVFAGVGFTYDFFRTAAANLRQKNDSYNEAIGGAAGGAILGLKFRTIPAVLGYAAGVGIVMSVWDYTGGSFTGLARDPNVDEYERKEALRRNRRKPIDETISELGEGRGIYAPGYEERRRERIRQRYGIDVTSSQSS